MKIKEELKPKLEEFILEFTNQYSTRNVNNQQQFCNYVYKLIENESESEEIDEAFCISKLEDFFGNKSGKFVAELASMIKNEERLLEKSNNTPLDILNDNEEDYEEKEVENQAKSESSQEESEGKNIFKYRRDFSDDEDESEEDRGHKRRKTSRQISQEKEKDDKDFKSNKQNFPKMQQGNESGNPMRPNFKKQPGMGGFPYQNPFMANNPMNNMFKKKFPNNNMNKKMMMPGFNPMFFPPHMYPPPMGFPTDYLFPPPNYSWNPNTEKPAPALNEYDPLNPGNTLLQNPSAPTQFFDPSKLSMKMPPSVPMPHRKFPPPPHNHKPQGEQQDLSRMLMEKNNEKRDTDEVHTPTKNRDRNQNFHDSDEKVRRQTGKSPRKSDKKTGRDTIYIKNIPNYYNSVETLSKYYKKFGSIENIQVEQNKLLATVKFMKPLDAVKAVNSNKKLFGKEDIFVTLNPEEEPPKKTNNPAQNPTTSNNNDKSNMMEKKDMKKKENNSLLAGKLGKFQEIKNKKEKEALKDMIKKKLANKLKFMLYLKNRVEKAELKTELLAEINKIKTHKDEIDKGSFDENIKELFEKENLDASFDYTLNINNLTESMLNYATLQGKLEVYGKIENMKIIKKESKAQVRFASFESAEKAYLNDHEFIWEFADPKLMNFMKKEEKPVVTQQINETAAAIVPVEEEKKIEESKN